jgi:hypothetical protein
VVCQLLDDPLESSMADSSLKASVAGLAWQIPLGQISQAPRFLISPNMPSGIIGDLVEGDLWGFWQALMLK